jgi:ABC-2 type transport system permease protein
VTGWLRLFLVGGLLAYRALFNWIRPSLYVPTMLLGPVFQILLFAYMGRYSQLEDDTFFVVGNAVQISCMSSIYAGTMAIANERQFQTLAPLLASPANRFALFMGRSLPVLANGLVVSAWGFGVGWALLDFDPAAAALPSLGAVLVVSVAAATAFGLTLGSIGMRARDVFLISNLAYYLFWVFCGVNVPRDELPRWAQLVGSALPLTHGIEAAREVVAGAALADVSGLVATEALVGLGYAALAFALFRFFEREGRRSAALETY